MYFSSREIQQEIGSGGLIFDPAPEVIDPSSVDLHLDRIEEARIWDIEKFRSKLAEQGLDRPELRIGKYNLSRFSTDYLTEPPDI